MKTILKSLALFMFISSAIAQAEIWVKPPYKTDENHPPVLEMPKEAQEEAPDESSEIKQHQEVRKPGTDMGLEKIDDQMNETEESNQ